MRRLVLPVVAVASLVGCATPTLVQAQTKPVRITKKGENILEFSVGDELVARYQYAGVVPSGDGTKPLAKPFFWPVHAPGGVPVTRAWPMQPSKPGETTDHVHQKSAWFCHGDVIAEGLELKERSADKRVHGIDFWAETPGHGRIVCVEVGEPKPVAPNHVMISTRNEWVAPGGTKVMEESRTIHLIALPAGRLIALDVDLHANVCPITFGDTKEGSMGVRVNDAIRADPKAKTGGVLTNAAGQAGEKDVWGMTADWCDYFGTIGGKHAGIAVFDHPTNPYRAAWHARGYGLMAANPFGRGESGFPSRKGTSDLVKLAKGDHLKLKYGIYAHGGDTTSGRVAEAYQKFAGGK